MCAYSDIARYKKQALTNATAKLSSSDEALTDKQAADL
jgi:hypothetical protein